MEKQLSDNIIKDIFKNLRNIAIIGVSPDPKKDSYQVMQFMKNAGYRIFPVNPITDKKIILGEKVFKRLEDIETKINIVNVFRPSNETKLIAESAKKIGADVLWLQLNIHNDSAKKVSEENGILYISNRCTKIEYERLFS